MNYWESILLGILQGLTEFLPVSSDGHLVVMQSLLGFDKSLLAFDVFIHLGTLAAVLVYYRKTIVDLASDVFARASGQGGRRLILLIIIASIPTAFIGLGLKSAVDSLNTSALAAAIGWLVTGAVLLSADRIKVTSRSIGEIRIVDALLIGIAQGLAVLPGVSRSGLTVATGMSRSFAPADAANFSFLMSIPAVAGAALLESRELHGMSGDEWSIYLVGALTAGVVGYFAIWMLLKLLARRVLKPFGWYCLVVAAATILALMLSNG